MHSMSAPIASATPVVQHLAYDLYHNVMRPFLTLLSRPVMEQGCPNTRTWVEPNYRDKLLPLLKQLARLQNEITGPEASSSNLPLTINSLSLALNDFYQQRPLNQTQLLDLHNKYIRAPHNSNYRNINDYKFYIEIFHLGTQSNQDTPYVQDMHHPLPIFFEFFRSNEIFDKCQRLLDMPVLHDPRGYITSCVKIFNARLLETKARISNSSSSPLEAKESKASDGLNTKGVGSFPAATSTPAMITSVLAPTPAMDQLPGPAPAQ